MKIVSFDSSRVTWLFPLEEFAPAARISSGSMVAEIGARYNFGKVPVITTLEDMAKNGLQFGMGRFDAASQPVVITDFIVYNDGIVAVSEKTEWGEAFLEDVSSWAKATFGFREVSSGIRKLYSSTIIADFENSPSRLISGLDRIAAVISSRAVTIMQDPAPMQFARLDFEIDRKTLKDGQVSLPRFVLERRVGVSFSQERYISIAPMHTEQHLETLSDIEKLAATL